MFATIAVAAFVDVFIAARAGLARFAGAASCIEALAYLQIFSLDLIVGGLRLTPTSSVAIIRYIPTGRGEMTAGVSTDFGITC